jgi:hypothetical protein
LVNLAPVSDARHFYFSALVINGVDHTVIANADAPQVSSTNELFAAVWSGTVPSALIFG